MFTESDLFSSSNLDYVRAKSEPEHPPPSFNDLPTIAPSHRANNLHQQHHRRPSRPSHHQQRNNQEGDVKRDRQEDTNINRGTTYSFPTQLAQDQNGLKMRLLGIIRPGKNINRNALFKMKLPGPQPMTLMRGQAKNLAKEKYFVCEKSDGERAMLYITHQGAYLIGRSFNIRRIECPFYADQFGLLEAETVLDGEMVDCKDTECSHELVYLAYDAVMVQGKYCGDMKLSERLGLITKHIALPYWERRHISDHPFAIKAKFFVEASQIDSIWRLISQSSSGHYIYKREGSRDIQMNGNDGLIFTAEEDNFFMDGDKYHLLKWKYPALNSIDLKVKRPFFTPDSQLKLYCHGPENRDILIRTVRLTTEHTEMFREMVGDRKHAIIEFAYRPHQTGTDENGDLMKCSWVPMRNRPDKVVANFWVTVMATLQTLVEDVTFEELKRKCIEFKTRQRAAQHQTQQHSQQLPQVGHLQHPQMLFQPQPQRQIQKQPTVYNPIGQNDSFFE